MSQLRRHVARLMEEKALREVHTQRLDRFVLLLPLHPLRDHLDAVIVGEAHHRLDQVLLHEVGVDSRDQGDVQLDEVGRKVGDASQPRIAGAGIVDGEAETLLGSFLDMMIKDDTSDETRRNVGRMSIFEGVKEFPVRVKCATLIWQALKDALQDVHTQKPQRAGGQNHGG